MRVARAAFAGAAVLAVVSFAATPPTGAAPTQAPSGEDARAWILVDAGSGVVLDGKSIHDALPASTTAKLMTALTYAQRMPLESLDISATLVTVTSRARNTPNPRLGLGEGSRFQGRPLLNGMILASANDAAYALAEGASGTIEAFADEMNTFGKELGLRDSTWNDPAGLDDDKAYNGGPTSSAWDLAIVARAILRDKELAGVVSDKEETINGPGLGKRVTSTNDLLYKYPGANGLKQAQSAKAGGVIVGSAARDFRTMIVVALGVTNPVMFVSEKLDAGFASSTDAKGMGERLPDMHVSNAQARLEAMVNLPQALGRPALLAGRAGAQAQPRRASSPTSSPATTTPRKRTTHDDDGGLSLLQILLVVLLFGMITALIVLRRRTVEQQRRHRAVRQRTLAEARRRGTIDIIDPDQVAGSSHVRIVGRAEPRRRGPAER